VPVTRIIEDVLRLGLVYRVLADPVALTLQIMQRHGDVALLPRRGLFPFEFQFLDQIVDAPREISARNDIDLRCSMFPDMRKWEPRTLRPPLRSRP
jgi:hypothetical protein